MSQTPEIALLISTYQRPAHLRRALLSVALQRDVAVKMEVVVTDDGSTDETAEVVRNFARSVGFPVQMTTHPHATFQLARCRNEGVAASTAPYLLFLDGDCILPPDHVATHLQHRLPGVVMAGNAAKVDQPTSERIDENAIRRGDFVHWASKQELRRLKSLHFKARIYQFLRHPTKPKLIGNNIALWRSDYERVNGFDENFQGWGCEDDDLRLRLRKAGVKVQSILGWTHTYHLWHPKEVTCQPSWKNNQNVEYLHRKGVLVRCLNGLVKRPIDDLRLRVVGNPPPASIARPLAVLQSSNPGAAGTNQQPEVEIVFVPSSGRFSGQAQCNVLVVLDDAPVDRRLLRRADIIVADREIPAPHSRRYQLREFENALKAVA